MVKHKISSLGFGLIELIVSISIMTLVIGIVVARHNAFNSAILLRNQAYEIAFFIRQAQQLAVSGTNTKELTAVRKQRYAVWVSTLERDMSGARLADKQRLVLYKENHNNESNSTFDGGGVNGVDELIQTLRLDPRFEIVSIQSNNFSKPIVMDNVRVLFTRPLYDAKFYVSTVFNMLPLPPVEIQVRRVGTEAPVRKIILTASGQVTVD